MGRFASCDPSSRQPDVASEEHGVKFHGFGELRESAESFSALLPDADGGGPAW
jgi:hypothetical protein